MAIVTVKNKYQVVIPQALRKQVGVNIGDLLEAKVEQGKITFTPKTLIDTRIAESMADYKAGRSYGPFNSHKDLIGSLHKQAKKLKKKK
jgi:bifunctional DNA-binding transcriptional regulator/antitoxin component of YhaV-PrlF toxin-antitoxin module